MIPSEIEQEELLSRILSDFIKTNRDWMMLGNIDLTSAVASYIAQTAWKAQSYSDLHHNDFARHKTDTNMFIRLLDILQPLDSDDIAPGVQAHPWNNVLGEYKGSLIVYTNDPSNIAHFPHDFANLNKDVLIVSQNDIPESISSPENFYFLRMEKTNIIRHINTYLMRSFPIIFETANALFWLLSIVSPSEIILLDTVSTESKVMNAVASGLGINVKYLPV
ncbi:MULTISPECIES: hypothetical protein [Bacteroidales]|uniref:hypothetical protein n=1 Tax=Bacteroidales TaxID=171549 RepID=UPI002592E06F|nr:MULTISPECIES: hypothetical protein [Bacteroidales]